MKKIIALFLFFCATSSMLWGQESQSVFTYKIGACEVSLLSEGQQNGQINTLIGATPDMLKQYAPQGTFPNATNAFLVRTPDKIMLADAGYGRKLFDNMQSLGVTAEQVNIVMITHMHGDHIGGLLRDGKVIFPNAALYLPQPEHDYWMSDEEMNKLPETRRGGFQNARKVIAAYAKQLHLFQPNEIDAKAPVLLFPGVQAIAAYGHTPGHTMYLLESQNERLLIWGDLTHAMAIQMPYPQVAVTYDVRPEQAAASRKLALEYVSKNNIPIAGMHIAFPAIGSIAKAAVNGYLFTPAAK